VFHKELFVYINWHIYRYCPDKDKWCCFNFSCLQNFHLPIIPAVGCGCFIGEYLLFYITHYIFHIFIVLKTRILYYSADTAIHANQKLTCFISLVNLHDEQCNYFTSCDKRYLKINIINPFDYKDSLFAYSKQPMFFQCNVQSANDQSIVTLCANIEHIVLTHSNKNYYIFFTFLHDSEKLCMFTHKFSRSFSIINPADLRD